MTLTQPKHLAGITTLRAIAALWVCLIHLGMVTGFHTEGALQTIVNEGQSGVAVFFVISGFILPYSLYKRGYLITDFGRFLLGRIVRIDPPYWASIVIVFLIGLQPVSALTIKSLLLHVTYLVPFIKGADWFSNIYWTLSIEFQFYIIIGLVYPFLMRLKAVYALAAVVIPSIICIMLKADFRGVIVTNLYDFTIGFIVFLGFMKKINARLLIAALALFSAYVMYAVSIKSGMVPLITSLAIVFYRDKLSFKPILFIGEISYSLYLIHIPASVLIVQILQNYTTNKGYLFVISLVFSLLSACAFYLLVEKHSVEYSKVFKSKRKPAS
ncbi:acyltransferase family protein [Mucilaginibacter aquariorum]|uniref:Acyltransferase n=1 Tax=Mucilaginibacter aquariorum TaxID=2967225 RepID=A0ABT1SYG0_9SPHI|nr:acyltransferase [Mucilaginibacter aquariorum]MCQ6957260.1 acyltransferase [Mucilaginibacter aquariorum]